MPAPPGRLRGRRALLGGGARRAAPVGGGIGLTEAGVSRQWPALVLAGGLALAAGGAFTALRGDDWPAMGARYERRAAPAAEPGRPAVERGTRDAWDALDRGEDPTVS
ncbi:Trp biosynthesis-associated membrane protein [Micromonospora echinospora]|uniref:Trp biosynthesis-associated membrane protein n=1 Tax=Micromonospora echinospora TaxID=1877 RepID=UPI003F4DC5BB